MLRDTSAVTILVGGIAALALLGGGPEHVAAQESGCDDRAALRVTVFEQARATRVLQATVVVQWTESERVRRPARQDLGADGRLVLCAPRDARQATLWAEAGATSSEEAVVPTVAGTIRDVPLTLRTEEKGTGRLIGQVRDAMTGDPVESAGVSVPDRLRTTETNRRGGFVLTGVPVGSQELRVRHIGYAPLSIAVDVAPGLTTEVEIGMVPDPVAMEPIVATALRSRRLEVKGFYERKHWGEIVGTGTFYTAEDIDRRRPLEISHMIADEPGIRLECNLRRTDCRLLNSRLSSRATGVCPLSFYVDGMPSRGTALDNFARPVEIAGVEIYKGLASGPAEFPSSRCGVIVVWTK